MCMRVVIAENSCSFRVENVDDLHTDQYNNKKSNSTDADFAKIVFIVRIHNLWGKLLQTIAICNKIMTTIHA